MTITPRTPRRQACRHMAWSSSRPEPYRTGERVDLLIHLPTDGTLEPLAGFWRQACRRFLRYQPVRLLTHGIADKDELPAISFAPYANQHMQPQSDPIPNRQRPIHALGNQPYRLTTR